MFSRCVEMKNWPVIGWRICYGKIYPHSNCKDYSIYHSHFFVLAVTLNVGLNSKANSTIEGHMRYIKILKLALFSVTFSIFTWNHFKAIKKI